MSKTEEILKKCGINIVKIIAKGGHGVVLDIGNNKVAKYSRKTFSYDDFGLQELLEIDIMTKIIHPNIMSIDRFILPSDKCKTKGSIIIMDKAIRIDGCIQDLEYTKKLKLIYELACGLKFMHDTGIVHGDIKPGNIIFLGNPENLVPVLIDFDLSFYIGEYEEKYIIPRNPIQYRAPELLKKCYDLLNYRKIIKYSKQNISCMSRASDIWSFAITILILLNNCKRFFPDSVTEEYMYEKYESILYEISDIKSFIKNKVSESEIKEDMLDLLSKMMNINYIERINIQDILDHKVFIDIKSCDPDIGKIKEINEFKLESKENVKSLINIFFTYFSDKKIETLFLSTDLLHRCSDLDIDSKTKIYTCIIMAIKLIQKEDIGIKYYFNTEDILKTETLIIYHLKGILHRFYLFDKAKTYGDILILLSLLFSKKYNKINIKKILKKKEFKDSKIDNIEFYLRDETINTFILLSKSSTLNEIIEHLDIDIEKFEYLKVTKEGIIDFIEKISERKLI